jgi:hypothetical protein
MKPGKPTTFASIAKPSGGRCYFFGLPGNPVSCLVCKALVVDPALKRLQGVPSKGLVLRLFLNQREADCMHPQVSVTTTQPYRLDPYRPEYHRWASPLLPWPALTVLLAHWVGSLFTSTLSPDRSLPPAPASRGAPVSYPCGRPMLFSACRRGADLCPWAAQ